MKIHDEIPSGFHPADVLQIEQYRRRGVVNGASKILVVCSPSCRKAEVDLLQSIGPDEYPRGYYEFLAERKILDLDIIEAVLAVRLHTPRVGSSWTQRSLIAREIDNHLMTPGVARGWYIDQYNRGWRHARTNTGATSAHTSAAYNDGYLDAKHCRAKWHMVHCADHTACGTGP